MTRRGAIMMEIVVALGMFVATAGLTLSIARNVLDGIDQAAIEQEAVDYVASRMAELETGLIRITELRDGVVDEQDGDTPPRWELDVDTERTEWRGLTLVALTVRPLDRAGDLQITLRQLVRLRDEDAEDYELDDMLQGLPE